MNRNRGLLLAASLLMSAVLVAVGLIYDSSRSSDLADHGFGYTPRTQEPRADDRLTVQPGADGVVDVLIIGDRISDSAGATTPEQGYINVIAQKFDQDGLGSNLTKQITTEPVPTIQPPTALPPEIDLTIIQVGTSDAGSSTTRPTSKDEFMKRYNSFLEAVQAEAGSSKLICVGTWYNKAYTNYLNITMKSACETAGGRFINVNDLYDKGSTRGPIARETFSGPGDSYFPNDEGHAALAERVFQAIDISQL